MVELALQHNEVNIQQCLFSISPLRVFTYQWAHTPINSLAPTHCQLKSVRRREKTGRGRKAKKKKPLGGFDMYSRTYMATPPANASLLEHICMWDGEGVGL